MEKYGAIDLPNYRGGTQWVKTSSLPVTLQRKRTGTAIFGTIRERTSHFVQNQMELYYAAGPDMVRELKDRGHKVFLDLELHDIPNTVKKSMRVLSTLGRVLSISPPGPTP